MRVVLPALLILAASVRAETAAKRDYTTPTRLLPVSEIPSFSDDYDFRDLEAAIQRQLKRFQSKDLTGTISLGGKKYPLSKARASLEVFLDLIHEFQNCAVTSPKANCYADFNAAVRTRFHVFAPKLDKTDPRFGEAKTALFTAYDTQPLEGRAAPDSEFRYPIYLRPSSAADRAKTRAQIDFHGALSGKGLEIVYTKSLFDLYLMHVEGGGYVTMPDGSGFFLSYNGTNGQKWNWISRYMLDKGYITNPSSPAQRKFLNAHPEKQEEIFSSCPSYVFYKVTRTEPAGSDQVPLTDGRSLATDSNLYAFKGLLAFVESRRPEETGHYDLESEDPGDIPFIPFSRFFLDQDTGGAIKGKARADLYFGKSDYALFAGTYQAELGRIFFLLLK